MIIDKEQITFFNQRIGKSLGEILKDSNLNDLQDWVKNASTKSKGLAGDIFEWIITGEKGDNKPEPDFKGWEIKTVSFNDEGEKALEKMSLTAVSYSTIENETFDTSHVLDKSKMFIIKLTKNKNVLERKFLGFGVLDLTLYIDQVKEEYDYYRNLVCGGNANKFSSKAKLLSEDQILHVRTAGTTKYREYITKKGIKYTTKPYNFTLDYNVITRLLKPII
tara:strand:+ start:157 stop:819 length:663 start_codon:yes stop_codon:yes gene_type:complete